MRKSIPLSKKKSRNYSEKKKIDKLKYIKTKRSGMANKTKSPNNLMEKTDNKFEQLV